MRPIAFALVFAAAAQASPATAQSRTPARGGPVTISVDGGSDFQDALDQAKPGDVIQLPAGATFTGNFVLPPKNGDRHITVRTAPSEGLPASGGRITPAHAAQLARIQSPNGAPALRTAAGAHHWRLMLLEFGPTAGGAGDIIVLGDTSAARAGRDPGVREIIIDRCFIHGHPQRGQKRGIALNSASTTIIGSHISDIKAIGQDAQAIGGWSGPGPFHIENNYLEASGENFMLGGATPAVDGLVPSDVVFRRNHVSRPPEWRTERWTVKNLFELKNARRVLVEGNLFENHWADSQPGYAIVLTPRGEGGRAPWAVVEDVTFRYNIIRNVGAVFNLLGRDDSGESGRLQRLNISQNLIYNVDRRVWDGNGLFMQIGDAPADIVVEHNTILQTGNIITAYGGTPGNRAAIDKFVFQNNITVHNTNGVIGQGTGIGADTLSTFFPDGLFVRNVMAGGRPSRYPEDNVFPAMEEFRQQFVDYEGRDYRLRPNSEFRRASTDGSDLGVNFVALVRTIGARAREWLGLASPNGSPR